MEKNNIKILKKLEIKEEKILIQKEFILVYQSDWSEVELLKKFITEIKKDPILCEMPALCLTEQPQGIKAKRKVVKPMVKNFNTFVELNLFIQELFVTFNLDEFRYPAFLALSYALQCSYYKNRNIIQSTIRFQTAWEYPIWDESFINSGMTPERYKHEKELPLNNLFKWKDQILL